MPFGGGSCRVGTSRLAYVVNRLAGFCMVWVFTERFFLTDFLIVLPSFIYLYYYGFFWSCWRYLWTATLEEFVNFIITIIIIIVIIIIIIIIISVIYHYFWFYCSFLVWLVNISEISYTIFYFHQSTWFPSFTGSHNFM